MYALLHKSGRIAPITGVLATRAAANKAARHYAMSKGITLAVVAHPGVLTAVQAGHNPTAIPAQPVVVVPTTIDPCECATVDGRCDYCVEAEEAGLAAAEELAQRQYERNHEGCGCQEVGCTVCTAMYTTRTDRLLPVFSN